MAKWFGKKEEELPEALRGLSEEQLIAAVAASRELEQTKEKLASLEAEGSTRKGELDVLNNRINELQTQLAAAQERREEPKREASGPTSVLIDEDKAFDERLGPTNAIAMHGAALSARLAAENQIMSGSVLERRIWQKYMSEVESLMEKEPPQRKILPQVWLNMFTYVKGLHTKDILKAKDEGNEFFAEVPVGGSGRHETSSQDDKLTDEELGIARQMKITPEQYLASKKSLIAREGGSGIAG